MAAKRYNVPPRPSLSQAELQRIQRDQASERLKRGFTDYSRSERREFVEGRTPGENKLQSGVRGHQVAPKPRKRPK